MEKESYFFNSGLLSHPATALEDHLRSVANLAVLLLRDKPPLPISEEVLIKCAEVVCLSHDIGKANSFFQSYISAPPEEMPNLKSRKSSHSLFGAAVAYFWLQEFLKRKDLLDGENIFLPIAAFLACKRHHGNLSSINYDIYVDDEEEDLLKQQLNSIDREKFDLLLRNLGRPFDYEWIEQKFEHLKEVFINVGEDARSLLRQKDMCYYFFVHFFYSILLDSDKIDVAVSGNDREQLEFVNKKIQLTPDLVTAYKAKQNWDRNDIDILREQAFTEVMSMDIDLNKRIYSLNLPTGLGKTLTSFTFALKLKEKLKEEKNYNPKIIYSLPFLSIIDQNYSVFENVLIENGIEPVSPIILKHHHLAELKYRLRDNNGHEHDFKSNASKILIEGWNSEIIVTTFIQLFYTLISNRNHSIRKFHRIVGSIVILDEVQAIPHKYWLLIHEIIQYLSSKYGTYFIFSTATEPLIFAREEVTSLVQRDKYFNKLNRLKLIPKIDDTLTIEELFRSVSTEILETNKKYLFIFNTINSAKQFYNHLQESGVNQQEMTYLSTHVIPKQRLTRIQEIKQGDIRIAVSTQLVEAGVDIDFDVVYRDFAPLDSINQSAGRCNRNGISSGGEVRVVRLVDNKTGKEYSSYIYGKNSILLDITREVLLRKNIFHEDKFLELIDDYYKLIQDCKSDQKSNEIIEAFQKLNYDGDDGINSFKLIDDDYEKADVFIQTDEDAIALWNEFLQISQISNVFDRREEFNKIKAGFYKHVVSVPIRDDLNLPALHESGPLVVSKSQLDEYYDPETGYILKKEVVAIW